ncbi:Tuberous sclerosis 2 protein -like protein [Escovopsis weberi]|uniref:Tuberous sclerosis 2 protein-like protein n=1 Tax=Escovopsis weberi TaxID=150374 RepID=A0A0M9VT73_ESCWE|nr:Tuberous sclerosis 2 protein -like protein [Escovopsis weberi]
MLICSAYRPFQSSSVFRGLTGSKSTKSPPPVSSSAAALPRTEFINATPINSRNLSSSHVDAFELLKKGSLAERIAAANSLRFAVAEYPLKPVLEIWYAAKDLIDSTKPANARVAGWELLTECVRHTSSTDLERKEYFQTVAAPAHPDDFHLQLAALVDLTHHGRVLTGFDYELLPLLTSWLQDAYGAAKTARKANQGRAPRGSAKGKIAKSAEDQNFGQLFAFILEVLKFSFNSANEAAVTSMIDRLMKICVSTSVEDDLRSSIAVIDAIVTFGSIPANSLRACIRLLSSIFCLVPVLSREAWHTLSNLCLSHNGQATVRILLDVLRNVPPDGGNDKDLMREVKSSLAVVQKLLTKDSETGYPSIPYALLVDGLSTVLKASPTSRIYATVLHLITSLFHDTRAQQALYQDGKRQIHRLIVEEDWSVVLELAADCFRNLPGDPNISVLLDHLDAIITQKSGDFVPRQSVIRFFTSVPRLLPDSVACTVLDYFQEFRFCSPSDLHWEDNLALVLDEFFSNRVRSSDTRLRALHTIMDAYEIVDLVGDGGEQNFIPRLAKRILQDVLEETDVLVLDAVITFMTSLVTSCDLELFDYIVDTLGAVVINDRLASPLAMQTSTTGAPRSDDGGYARMFLRLMNTDQAKSLRLFQSLVSIAKLPNCEIDARLTAMKVLFRLRADWAHRIFITTNIEVSSLASTLCRTDASLAKKQADEAAHALRLAKSDHAGGAARLSRGVSLGQDRSNEKPARSASRAGLKNATATYHQIWKYPDPEALPESPPSMVSPILVSHIADIQGHVEDDTAGRTNGESAPGGGDSSSSSSRPEVTVARLNMSAWLDAVLSILRGGSDWEIYSFMLVHLPSQISNHALLRDAIPQIRNLRSVLCEQMRTNGFQEPPNASGLRRGDVAMCLYNSLTIILSYHEHFQKADEDDIVTTFIHGIATWERSAKACIHALSICCHELPLSASRMLTKMLNQMSTIITQPAISVHILEFLACLSRLHDVYANFREDEFRIVFAICFRYLEYARDQARRASKTSHPGDLSVAVASVTGAAAFDASQNSSPENLPQYVHALAYHVILFWFLALRLPDRANHVGWIVKKLFADADGSGQGADEQAITSIDFMQRVTYADVDESAEDPHFTRDRFGEILTKRWLVGNSIITVKQATVSGWAQIIKRQPSGTSAYTIREFHLLVQLLSPVPQSSDSLRPISLPDDDATDRAIRVFDRFSSLDGHKVGVIYIGQGQTHETEILANVSGSSDYVEFLNNLGKLTKLKGATFNTQGLDRENDIDGQYTFCWRDRVTEIVFHVTTQMPTNLERDPQCIMKKRHIGNDFVNIIFNDSGLPFDFDTFPSQFNFVNIVITPASPASFIATREAKSEPANRPSSFYTVQVMSKPGFPEVSPAADAKMVSLKALPGFIRLLALNASVFSLVWWNREGGEHISSWSGRLREIRRLRERYGPRQGAGIVASPTPMTPNAGSLLQVQPQMQSVLQQQHQQQHQQPGQDSSRPGSSVRDSFNSLRRTSVATFFSMSEQPSHRSSVMSTSAATNDTEVSPSNGLLDMSVDSVDFSKWA